MRIAMMGGGSRGDVQPMAVLGAELARRGHDVVLCVPDDLVELAGRLGLGTVPLGVGARQFLESEEGQGWLAGGDPQQDFAAVLASKLRVADTVQPAMVTAAGGADLVVSGQLNLDEAACIAEAQGIPVVALHLAPWRPNTAFPPLSMSTRRSSVPAIRLAHELAQRIEWRAASAYVNAFRRRLGLPPASTPVPAAMARRGCLEVQAFSRFLVPELAGWGPRRPLVGFLTPTAEQRRRWGEAGPDPALEDWLAGGEAPVFFGFGSTPIVESERMLALIRTVTRALGVRALVGTGWTQYRPESLSGDGDVRLVGATNHEAVLPRCRVAVHHGGAGTTAACVRAGLPAVACSFSFDQPFWGRQLESRGIGSHLPFRELDQHNLGRAVEALLADGPQGRARRLGAALRQEHADRAAADHIGRLGTGADSLPVPGPEAARG